MNYKHKLILLLALMFAINTNSMWRSNLFSTQVCVDGDRSTCDTILAGLTPQQVILLTSSTAALAIVGFNSCRRFAFGYLERQKQEKLREEAAQRSISKLQQARVQQAERDRLDAEIEHLITTEVTAANPGAVDLVRNLWLKDDCDIRSEVSLSSFVPVYESWDYDYSQDE